MAIVKDPDELPNDVIEFTEVFSDINTPEIWIARSQEDLGAKAIILDGHSSIIVYTQTDDLKWEAYNDLGQYAYSPENVGDGVITFPHTFYFEFEVELSSQIISVSANFDGTGIKAIVMPFKDVPIENFFDTLSSRLSSTVSSVLKPADDKLSIEEGSTLQLPEGVTSNLSLKLAMMGFNLSSMKVIATRPLERSEDIVEEIFEEPEPIEAGKMVEGEEEDTLVVDEEVADASIETIPSPPPSTATAGGGGAAMDDMMKGIDAPPTPPKAIRAEKPASKEMAEPPKPPAAKPMAEKSEASPPPPPSSPPTPGGPPSPTPAPVEAPKEAKAEAPASRPSRSRRAASKKKQKAKPTSAAEMKKEETAKEPLDSLIATGMDQTPEEAMSLKNAHASWFERMLQQRTYPLVVTISSERMKVKKSMTSPVSGEKVSEKSEELVVSSTDPYITVRPDFPGCLVVPAQQRVLAETDRSELTFHVTPLTLGNVLGSINFMQDNQSIHRMVLDSKVITHRITRWSAAIGTLISTIPAIVAFFFGASPQEFLDNNYKDSGLAFLEGIGYLGPILLSIFFFGIAGAGYVLQQPVKRQRDIAFST